MNKRQRKKWRKKHPKPRWLWDDMPGVITINGEPPDPYATSQWPKK